jgi:hypothetical protein
MSRRIIYPFVGGGILVVLLVGTFFLNRQVTAIVEGPKFRAMLEKETAKGMHFEQAHYAPITREGIFGMRADSGVGEKGFKTIVSLRGDHVTGAFNPLGIFLKRWQLQYLHFDSGTVMLQKTESNPNAAKPPGQPWYLFFWPDRVYLKDITVEDTAVLFKLQDKESGIYHTFLEITPNGRDFEYDAKGGTFKIPVAPALNVEHIHLLVRKPRLYCETMILGDDPDHPEEQARIEGEAGLQQDRGITAKADLDHLKISPWLPENMRPHVLGHFDGHFDYKSTGTGLETSQAQGDLTVADGVLHNFKMIKTYIDATRSPDPGDLPLKVCRVHLRLDQGAIIAENLEIESDGVFRLSGTIRMDKDKTLSGDLQLGLTAPYLHWLPTLQTNVFTRTEGDYHFTTVHLSGTSTKPQQDLSARILKEVGDHPFVALKLFFNSAGDWFN